MNRKQKKMLARIILSAMLMIAFAFIPSSGLPRLVMYLFVYFLIGYDNLSCISLCISSSATIS